MSTKNQKTKISLILPAIFKFSMEIFSWLWLLIASITVNILFILAFILSIIGMGVFTFPGDKAHDGPVSVPGWIRIYIEIVFVALFGITASYYLFGEIGLILQSILVLLSVAFEFQRYLWMLGFKDSPPEYTTYWKNKMSSNNKLE